MSRTSISKITFGTSPFVCVQILLQQVNAWFYFWLLFFSFDQCFSDENYTAGASFPFRRSAHIRFRVEKLLLSSCCSSTLIFSCLFLSGQPSRLWLTIVKQGTGSKIYANLCATMLTTVRHTGTVSLAQLVLHVHSLVLLIKTVRYFWQPYF